MKWKMYRFIKQKLLTFTQSSSRLILGVSSYSKNQEEKQDFEYFKNQAFFGLAILFLLLGLLPICYGAYLFFKESNIIAGVFEILVYLVVLTLLLNRRISLIYKKNIFVLSTFSLGLMLLIITGPMGAGLIVMVSTLGLTACFLSNRQSMIVVFISLLSFIVISVLLNLGVLDNLAVYRYGESWYIAAISAQSLGTLFVLIITNLFNNIKNQVAVIEMKSKMVEEKNNELADANTKTQQLLEDLKKEQKLIESIFDSIPGYLYVYDESEKLIKWNKKHETMTGFTAEELSSMTLEKWFDQEDIVKVRAAVHDVFDKGYGEVEAQLILKNGKKLMTRSSGAPLILDEKKYFAGIGIDITEKKKMETEIKQSEERFQLLFNRAPLGYQSLDSEGCFIEVNQKWLDSLGYSKEEVIGKWFGDFLCPEYVEGFRQRFPIFKAQGHIYSEFDMLTNDRQRITMAFEGRIGNDSEGKFIQTHCILQDITDQRKAEKALIESEERYKALFENAGVGIGYYSKEGIVLSYNKLALKNMGGKLEDYIGKSIRELFPKETAEIYFTRIEKAVTSDKSQEYEDYLVFNSVQKWFLSTFIKIMNITGEVLGVQIVSLDITERKFAEEELLYLSNHDSLTGLYNRRFYDLELKRLESSEKLPLSFIVCDINGLKLINDSLGHDAGDQVIKKVAKAIENACRIEDIIVRSGGDEFIVILPMTSASESLEIAKHMKELASKESIENIEVSISFGYDTKEIDKQSIIEIIANAENYMYRNKLHERSSMRSKTIDLIMSALFEKSKRESTHSNRVGNICESIASKMNLDKDTVNQMRIAGFIHDIGKIGIDEKILNKPGSLTIHERGEIEKHPEIGWRLLSSTKEFSELAQFVLSHHEKWDGSGYPNGLTGEKIPLESRIISVADAYDAMTRDRSYRKGLDKEEAIKEMKRCSGTQFDPEIVDIFVNQIIS